MSINFKALAHRGLVVVGYIAEGATFVNEIGKQALDIGIPLPGWARLAIPAAGVIAIRLAKLLPAPGHLDPTKDIVVEDTGAALGKASGEAGAAAGRGPFKR